MSVAKAKLLLSSSGSYAIQQATTHKRVFFSESLEILLDHLRYPDQLALYLPEHYFYYGNWDLHRKQSEVITITQLKQQIQQSKIALEIEYGCQLSHSSYDTSHIFQNGNEKEQLLGLNGDIHRKLHLQCLKPEYAGFLKTFEDYNCRYSLQPRCQSYIQSLQIKEGNFLLIDKYETQLLCLTGNGRITSVHTLNTGYKDFYHLLHQHHCQIQQCDDEHLGSFQAETIDNCCKQFFASLIDRAKECNQSSSRYCLSDINNHSRIAHSIQALTQEKQLGFFQLCPIQKHIYDELLLA